MPPTTRPDDQVRSEDAERVGNDAVENRAISVGNIVRNRRAAPDARAERAAERSYYRSPDGRRRIVGAGQVVPDGWVRLGPASIEDRREAAIAESGLSELAGGNTTDTGRSSRSSSSSSSEPSKEDLQKRAAELDVEGRSKLKKPELQKAIAEAEAEVEQLRTRAGELNVEGADELGRNDLRDAVAKAEAEQS